MTSNRMIHTSTLQSRVLQSRAPALALLAFASLGLAACASTREPAMHTPAAAPAPAEAATPADQAMPPATTDGDATPPAQAAPPVPPTGTP